VCGWLDGWLAGHVICQCMTILLAYFCGPVAVLSALAALPAALMDVLRSADTLIWAWPGQSAIAILRAQS